MASQFYVQPAGDITPGLSGLSSIIKDIGEDRKTREAAEAQSLATEEAQAAVIQGMRSGDASQMMELSVLYPEYREQMEAAATSQTGIQQQERVDFMRSALANPQGIPGLYEDRIQDLQDRGRDPTHTIESLQRFLENPEAQTKEMEMMFAYMAPEEYEALKAESSGIGAETDLGQLQQDLNNGFINQEQYDQAVSLLQTPGDDAAKAATDMGKLQQDLDAGFITEEQYVQGVAELQSGGAGDQRDRKIADLSGRLGDIPNASEIATNIVDGFMDVEILDDGTVMLTDLSKVGTDPGNAVTYLPVGTLADDDTRAAPGEGESLYDLAGGEGGIAGAGRQALARIAGQFGMEAFPETVEAYQTIDTAVGDMIRSLAVNPRFPVGEMNRLREEINITPSITNPGVVAQAKMRSIDRSLRMRMDQFARDAEDMTLSPEVRNNQRTNLANIQNFIDVLGVPESIDVEGMTIENIGELDRNDARSMIEDITEDQFNQLSPEVVEALMSKARG